VVLADTDESVWVEFLDQQGEPVDSRQQRVELTVEGPAGKIQPIREKSLEVRVNLDVEALGYTAAVEGRQAYEPEVVKDLLNGRLEVGGQELAVTKSTPVTLGVAVWKLVKRSVPVKVYDEGSGAALTGVQVKPKTVEAYVKEGESAEARVTLTAAEQTRAANEPLGVSDIELPYGRGGVAVEISLPQGDSPYPQADIRVPRWGVLLPASMLGRYDVVIENDALLKESIKVRGTTQAVAAYREGLYHLVLEVRETDEVGASINRPLHYYLPAPADNYGEIEVLNPVAGTIPFHLVPVGEGGKGEAGALRPGAD